MRLNRSVWLLATLLIFTLASCDGSGGGGSPNPGSNTAPVANAGADQNVATGSRVELDGSASTDADRDLLSYEWAFASTPTASEATLSGANTATPAFTADVPGEFKVSLVVSDGTTHSEPEIVTVVASSKNSAPVADAGSDRNVKTGTIVQLDGTGSSDANEDLITYDWSFVSRPDGSTTALSGSNTATPSFKADTDGKYVAKLVVNDGTVDSDANKAIITAATLDNPPMADAGPDQNLLVGDQVALDGSVSSDADGDQLTYSWQFVSKPSASNASLKDANTVSPSFMADKAGDYVVELTVNDGSVGSAPDRVIISVSVGNAAPVADAGRDQDVGTGSLVKLDATGSHDANNGDLITYHWFFVSKPVSSGAELSDKNSPAPSLTADLDGDYVVRLVATDGTVDSSVDTVTIAATTVNSKPVAAAGPDQNLYTGLLVNLDGSGSSDADGDPLSHRWSIVSAPSNSETVLTNEFTETPAFTPDVDGEYVVELVVNDGGVDSAPDRVTITAATNNSAPVAVAGPDQHVATGVVVTLDGSASSDADFDPLYYRWQFVSMPEESTATLSGVNPESPSFTADVAGDYVIQLIVNDGTVDSQPDQIMARATVTTASAGFNEVCSVPERNVQTVGVRALGQITTDPISYTAGWYSLRAISDTEVVMWGGNTSDTNNSIRVYDRELNSWAVLYQNSPSGSFDASTETWSLAARQQWCPDHPSDCKILTGTDTHLQFYIPDRNEMLIWGTSRSGLFGGAFDFGTQEWMVIWNNRSDIGTQGYITADTVVPPHIFPENASHRWVDPDGPGGSPGVGVIYGGTPVGNPTDKLLLIKPYPGNAYVFEMVEDSDTPPAAIKNNRNGAIAAGECFYLFGGETSSGPTNDVWRYHIPTDSWAPMADMPAPSSWNTASFDPYTNRVVVLAPGGQDHVYLYNLEENTWSDVTADANLPEATQPASAYAWGTHILNAAAWNNDYRARVRFYGIELYTTP